MKERFMNLVRQIEYKNWTFHIGQDNCSYCGHDGRCWLQVRWNDADTYTGMHTMQHGRKWQLSEHMTDSEVVLTALKAVLTAEEHEAREKFRYQGANLFNPHPPIGALVGLANLKEVRK